jgi:iron(III) transport system substrate-binding protein
MVENIEVRPRGRTWLPIVALLSGVCLSLPVQAAGEFADSYDAIVAAAAKEAPVHVCTAGLEPEVTPVLKGFAQMFPDVPPPVWERCNGVERRERILTEYAAGQPTVDVFEPSTDLFQRVVDSGFALTPDWSVFNGTPLEIEKGNINGAFVAAGSRSPVIVYNTDLVSANEAPKSFADCADPKWHGQLMVDVRPIEFTPFLTIWGEERLRQWAKGVAANKPMWTRSSSSFALLAQGERKFQCAFNLAGYLRAVEGGAKNLAYRFSEETPTIFTLTKMIATGTHSPNAALLLSAYWASKPGQIEAAEGNPGYGSPFIEGTWKQQELAKATGVKLINVGWDDTKTADKATAMIVEEWGFPKPTAK